MALTDMIKPRIVELGKIKIGKKEEQERISKSGVRWHAPMKVDHFILTTLHRDKNDNLIRDDELMNQLINNGCGDSDGKLRQLPIALLSNDIDDIIQASYVWYIGKKVAARSDGKSMIVYYDRATKTWLPEPREVDWSDDYKHLTDDNGNRMFKLHTVFNCVIAAQQSRWGGFYRFRTTSEITAAQLVGSIMHLKELTGGVLRGLPLRLAIRPMQVNPMVQGKPQSSTIYVVHVELLGSDLMAIQNMALERAKFELSNARQFEQTRIEYQRMLRSPGDDESATEISDVVEEFQPQEDSKEPGMDPLAEAFGFSGGPSSPAVEIQPPECEEVTIIPDDIPAVQTIPLELSFPVDNVPDVSRIIPATSIDRRQLNHLYQLAGRKKLDVMGLRQWLYAHYPSYRGKELQDISATDYADIIDSLEKQQP